MRENGREIGEDPQEAFIKALNLQLEGVSVGLDIQVVAEHQKRSKWHKEHMYVLERVMHEQDKDQASKEE